MVTMRISSGPLRGVEMLTSTWAHRTALVLRARLRDAFLSRGPRTVPRENLRYLVALTPEPLPPVDA